MLAPVSYVHVSLYEPHSTVPSLLTCTHYLPTGLARRRRSNKRPGTQMQRKLDLARRKEAEVAQEAERQDIGYMRRVRGGHATVMRPAMACYLPPCLGGFMARWLITYHTSARLGIHRRRSGGAHSMR